ncbi:MAG: hypothetical protein ACI4I6_07320 [Hominimerdicola sp.]
MKKRKTLLSISACIAAVLSTLPVTAAAEGDDYIYGTMNIPYADFYKTELSGSANEYEVDAVSSATTAKWCKNGEGELFEGTYHQANADGTGTILGVTYPVALTQETLDYLGENNYGFTKLSETPEAYKTVTVNDGVVSFSCVQDTTPDTMEGTTADISTSTAWGDYLISTENAPENMVILGAILKTESGESYAMRHLENIWRGEFAWSTGFVTQEPHGNTLSYENFEGLMGETITEILYITKTGYTTLNTSLYVPIKFENTLTVDDAYVTDGITSVTMTGFPADYNKSYTVDGLEADFTETSITFTNAMAGGYTLTVSDTSGVYADVTADFVLKTDAMPAVYDGNGKIVKADGASDDEFKNFLRNLETVSVNGTSYQASGRKSVKIIDENGSIDFNVVSGGTNVFDGSGTYSLVVNSTGYTTPLEFTVTVDSTNSTSSINATSNVNSSVSSKKSSENASTNPNTGLNDIIIPAAVLSIAGVSVIIAKKKKN